MKKNYKHFAKFANHLLLFMLLAFSISIHAQNTQVSVFNFPGLNGNGGCGDENENLIGIIDALPDYDVDGSIVNFEDPSLLATQLDASTFFFMTDMERESPSNTAFLPVASRGVFENWVNEGGVMVMTGTGGSDDNDFLNLIFGWDLTRATNSSWTKNISNTTGTPFEAVTAQTLPSLSATDAINKNSVPNFTTMWGTDDNAVVAVIEYGAGYVIFMGWDFFNSGPGCPQYSSDWVQQVIPSALDYASELSEGAISNISYTTADLSYSFSESGQSYYMVVDDAATAPTPEQIKAGSDYDAVSVIDAGNAATSAGTPHDFNLTGLTYNTPYTVYVVTEYVDGTSTFSQVSNYNFSTLDNDAPSLSGLSNQTVDCLNTPSPEQTLTISDEYTGDETFTVSGSSSDATLVKDSEITITGTGSSRTIEVSPEADASGTATITILVEDSLGAQTSSSFDVTFQDTKAPVAITQDITVELDETGNATITTSDIDNSSTDNCSIASLTLDIESFDCSSIGENTVTLTATDTSGNTSTETAIVTVVDNSAPVVVTQNITAELDETGNATITASDIDNSSTDNCSIASLTLDIESFDCSSIGENTVTLTAADESGNTSTETAIVTVVDNLAPVAITQNITAELDETGNAVVSASDVDNNSTDNCGIAGLTLDIESFDCSNIGENTVTLTVTDKNGNTSTETAIVTVEDNLAPVAITQNITVELDETGNATIAGSDLDNSSTDNCGIAGLTLDIESFDCSSIGENTVTLTAADESGNTSTETAIVTVVDNSAPVVITQDITIDLAGNPSISILPEDIVSSFLDNCSSIENISLNLDLDTFTETGVYTVNLTATDANANSSSAFSAQVTVENPTLSSRNFESVKVKLYPNPASSQITIDTQNSSISKVSIYDMNGRLIKTSQSQNISVSGLSNGVYFARVEGEDAKQAKMIKFIKN